jgi:hypothetical protein
MKLRERAADSLSQDEIAVERLRAEGPRIAQGLQLEPFLVHHIARLVLLSGINGDAPRA